MFLIVLYLVFLFIAPQLWIEPFVGMRVDYFLYPLWMVWVVLTGRFVRLVQLRPNDWFFLGFLFWLAVTIGANPLHERSGEILFTYAKWFLLYRLVVVTLPTLLHVKWAMLLVLFFSLALALQSIQQIQDPGGIGWAGQDLAWTDDEAKAAGVVGRTRWINIFDGPGVYCVVFTMALPVAMQFLWKPFGWTKRLVGLLLTGVLLLATYYTGSRGGFLATVVLFGLFLAMKLRISVTRMAIVGIAMLAVFLVAPAHLTSTRDSHGSAQHRIDMWGQGIKMVQQRPMLGIGRGNYMRYTGSLIAHNSALEIMGETGLPGMFLWLGIIYTAFKAIALAHRENQDPVLRSYLVALALMVAGYLLSGFFVTLEFETFYFLLALAGACGATLAERLRFGIRDAGIIAGIMVAFFIAVKGTVMLYY